MKVQPPAERERVKVESNSHIERETKCEERERIKNSDIEERERINQIKKHIQKSTMPFYM